MALAIDFIDRRDPSNKMHCQLQPKKLRKGCTSSLYSSNPFYPSFIANKTKYSSFNSGCVIRVKNGEMRGELQPKKTMVRLYYPFI